ncbi:MAG TPA: glycosyltransferase [Verrucomicrobiae bacterium]|nr:glycosyltransferase [Verrucomicrobiae bacterium]
MNGATDQNSATSKPTEGRIASLPCEGAPQDSWGPAALQARRERTATHLAQLAEKRQSWIENNRYYYQLLTRLLQFLVEPGKRVLSLRCSNGVLLAATRPGIGKGIEICEAMADIAREQYSEFSFEVAFPDTKDFLSCFSENEEPFDYISFNDIDDTVDVQQALLNLRPLCARHTRILITTYNHLWEPLVTMAEAIGMKVPRIEQNWFSSADVANLLTLSGYELLQTRRVVLCPKYIPLLSSFLNDFFARLPGINRLCMTEVHVARMIPPPRERNEVSVSVIIPCKDERGNVADAVRRLPPLGGTTEIIFCDDKSTDGTADEVKRMQRLHPERNIRLENGPGICKAENVWTGFEAASGDVLVILDADLTTMPEELPYFVDAIASGAAEFINGSRLVYPVPKGAMKAANMIGNKFFGLAFSYLFNQRVKDTLCGTKVLWRSDWKRIRILRGSWGIEDRWGDYELLFGAAKLNLRIIDLPVHYQERMYGTTKMTKVFKNGLIMLKMCWHGFLKLKLNY